MDRLAQNQCSVEEVEIKEPVEHQGDQCDGEYRKRENDQERRDQRHPNEYWHAEQGHPRCP